MSHNNSSITIKDKNFDILISQTNIQNRIIELASRISNDYKNKDLVMICVLKGAFLFFCELVKRINLNVKIDFIEISSYKGKIDNEKIELIKDISLDVKQKDLLLIEDIVDSGNSIKYLKNHLLPRNPRSLKVFTLINKLERRKYKIDVEYIGFEVNKGFILGYGMDYKGYGRNLNHIYKLSN